MHLYNVSKNCGWLTSSPRVAGLHEQDFVTLCVCVFLTTNYSSMLCLVLLLTMNKISLKHKYLTPTTN